MAFTDIYPIIPLPYESVLFPGRKLQISSVNRQDIIAIIADYYKGAFASRSKQNPALIGCVPLRSHLLSPDGKKLIESDQLDKNGTEIPDAAQAGRNDLFDFGVVARIHSIEGGKNGDLKVVVEGVTRFKLEEITQEKPYFEGRVKLFKDEGRP